MVAPRDPPVERVGEAGVGEEGEGEGVVVVEDGVADEGGGDEARGGEEVGEGVDVFAAAVRGAGGVRLVLAGGGGRREGTCFLAVEEGGFGGGLR